MFNRILATLALITLFALQTSLHASLQDVLNRIAQRAKDSQSDAVLITHEGKTIFAYGCDNRYRPIETRSVTKSFVCLAIGMLIQEGKIRSLETPVYAFFPEWNQGVKKEITLRHLLNNTSGIMNDSYCIEVYQAPDTVSLALAADIDSYPGKLFFYNNKAINLLSGIVEKASGMRLHDYLKSHLFVPLGITSDTWLCDEAGHNFGMSHLTLNTVDLAKVGLLLINNGYWNCKKLLASEWIEAFAQTSQHSTPFYGMLWWLDYRSLDFYWDRELMDQYLQASVPKEYVRCLEATNGFVFSLTGRINYGNFVQKSASQLASYFGSEQAVYHFFAELESRGLPIAKWNEGMLKSYSARGYLGQRLVVMPEENIVAVRLAQSCGQWEGMYDTFRDFEDLLDELVSELAAPAPAECTEMTPLPTWSYDNSPGRHAPKKRIFRRS